MKTQQLCYSKCWEITIYKRTTFGWRRVFVKIHYNQYILPMSVGFTASGTQLMFEYDAINYNPNPDDFNIIRD